MVVLLPSMATTNHTDMRSAFLSKGSSEPLLCCVSPVVALFKHSLLNTLYCFLPLMKVLTEQLGYVCCTGMEYSENGISSGNAMEWLPKWNYAGIE